MRGAHVHVQAALTSGTIIYTGASNPAGTVSVLKTGATSWNTTQTPIAASNGVGLCVINNGSTALIAGGQQGGQESAAVQVWAQIGFACNCA